MSENKDNKLTLINEKTANDYLTHTQGIVLLQTENMYAIFYIILRIVNVIYTA